MSKIPNPPKAKVRPELIISIVSLCLSLMAAATNLFQARLQREQQQTAVWPYLEANLYINAEGFSYFLANKGVGPAIITSESYSFRGQQFSSAVDVVKAIATGHDINYSTYSTEPAKNRVLSPQESLKVFRIANSKIAEMLSERADSIKIAIEYKSIYGKRWICKGREVEELPE